jgi:hypothetical protein
MLVDCCHEFIVGKGEIWYVYFKGDKGCGVIYEF